MKDLCLVSFLLLFYAPSLFAQDIRVVDSYNITRALTKNTERGTVIFVVESERETQYKLENIDGVVSSKKPSRIEGKRYIFANVPSGTWKIVGEQPEVVSAISEVIIKR